MYDVLEILIPWIVSTACMFVIVIYDERRMGRRDDPCLERAWPPAGRNAAIVAFGIIAIPVHFIRTRRSVYGVALGVAWGCAAFFADALTAIALDAIAKPG